VLASPCVAKAAGDGGSVACGRYLESLGETVKGGN
jgi:hypothetical protein